MTAWTSEELSRIGTAEELQITSRRRDGTLGRPRTIWVVRHRDDLYIRSMHGPAATWYRGTRARREGHIWAGGANRDVSFADAPEINDELDAIYRAKYQRHSTEALDLVTSQAARSTTTRLMPR